MLHNQFTVAEHKQARVEQVASTIVHVGGQIVHAAAIYRRVHETPIDACHTGVNGCPSYTNGDPVVSSIIRTGLVLGQLVIAKQEASIDNCHAVPWQPILTHKYMQITAKLYIRCIWKYKREQYKFTKFK